MPEGPEGIAVEHIVSQAKGAYYNPEDVDIPQCKCFLFLAPLEKRELISVTLQSALLFILLPIPLAPMPIHTQP